MLRQYCMTGIPHIDRQHGELFNRLEQLLYACARGAAADEFSTTVTFLTSYVVDHFTAEEELQQKHGYPDYPGHKAQHETFMRNLEFIGNEVEANRVTSALIMQVNQMLIDWLTDHIGTHDRRMGDFIAMQLS